MFRIFLLFILSSFTAGAQEPAIHAEINNSKTAKHINIPGTHLYIIPPKDFVLAQAFIGLQKGDKNGMVVYDLVGGNFYTNASTFSRQAFESKGLKVFEYKEIKVNGYPAKYIFMQGDPNTNAYSLVFGDTSFSTMIMSFYPVSDAHSGSEILNALNSIYYDKDKKINPFETARFSLNDHISTFKFFQFNANLFIYTIGGKDNKDDKETPAILVSQFPKDNSMTAKSIGEMMIDKLKQYGLTNLEMKNESSEKINGYDTYQVEIFGQMQGQKSAIYQCVVTGTDIAISIQGIAKKDYDTNIAEFKKLAATIRLK
jgi:hypothetical protein